jgi:hypothetical protein
MTFFSRARFFFMAPTLVACMAQAQGPEWIDAKHSEPGRTIYIKAGSVQRSKRGVTVWLKHQFEKPLAVKEFNASVTMMMEKAEYSADRKWSLRILMYDGSGKQVVDHSNPPGNAGMELIPETVETALAQQVRGLLPKGKKS